MSLPRRGTYPVDGYDSYYKQLYVRRPDKSTMEVAAKRFFTSPYFAVVGASQDRSKFGFKIFAWYHAHTLAVIPINPSRPSIALPSKTYTTVASPGALPDAPQTALSFLTPPSVTRKVLEDARIAGVKSVWLQPGSYDEGVMKYAKENFENAVGGFDEGTVGGEGWCVLVDGENCLEAAGRAVRRQKL